MPKTKRVNFDFYQLSLHGKKNKEVASIFGYDDYRIYAKEGNPIFLHGTLMKKNGLITGTLILNQMEDIPPSYHNTQRKMHKLKLVDDEGIAHSTAFLFDTKNNILMIESTRSAVSLNSFCHFFENTSGETIYTTIVLEPDSINRFYKMDIISKFEFRISHITDGSVFNDASPQSFGEMKNIAEESNTDKLDIMLRAKTKSSLRVKTIKGYVKNLLSYQNTRELEKIKVTGREEGGTNTLVDLLKDKMRLTISFDVNRFTDIIFLNEKLERMEEAYNEVRASLVKTYSI